MTPPIASVIQKSSLGINSGSWGDILGRLDFWLPPATGCSWWIPLCVTRGALKPDLKSRGLETDNMQKGGITISQSSLSDPRQIRCQKGGWNENINVLQISLQCFLFYTVLCRSRVVFRSYWYRN